MAINWNIETHQTIDSTNIAIKKAITAGRPEGTVVLALEQTAGYGRQGRVWKSPQGGVYFSLLLRPQVPRDQVSTLGHIVAMAVRQALFTKFHVHCDAILLKWPNDLIVPTFSGYLKLCGMSLECVQDAVCVGIGINVIKPKGGIKTDGRYEPAFVSELDFEDELPDLNLDFAKDFVACMLSEIEKSYTLWLSEGFAPFIESYKLSSFVTGKCIKVSNVLDETVMHGVAGSVNEKGALLLHLDDESVVELYSGEVHLEL